MRWRRRQPLGAAPRRIVANLPYNVATPLLIDWLAIPDPFESLMLMFQKEVAARLAARRAARPMGGFRCWRNGAAASAALRHPAPRLHAAAASDLHPGPAAAAAGP